MSSDRPATAAVLSWCNSALHFGHLSFLASSISMQLLQLM